MRDTYTQMLRLGLAIVALALLLYWADASYFAPRRLPPCQQESLPEGRICPEILRTQWAGRTVWVDARSESDYELNHLILSDNRMFPIRTGDFAHQFDAAIGRLIEAGDRNECIVVFCTQSCSSAEDIAARLRLSGLITAPIFVLEGGWDALKQDPTLAQ